MAWHGPSVPTGLWRVVMPQMAAMGRTCRWGSPTGPKELHWIQGASHIDLYHKPEYVNPAAGKLSGFFAEKLAAYQKLAA